VQQASKSVVIYRSQLTDKLIKDVLSEAAQLFGPLLVLQSDVKAFLVQKKKQKKDASNASSSSAGGLGSSTSSVIIHIYNTHTVYNL